MRSSFLGILSLLLVCGTGWTASANETIDELVVKGDVLIRCPKQFRGIAVIPDGIHHIAEYAFLDCRHLTGVVFPRGILSIGDRAFCGCYGLTEVELPESVTYVGAHAFSMCWNMTNMIVNAAIHDIPQGMCNRCMRLENVTLPKGLRRIGTDAFRSCRSLRETIIPADVTNISETAFASCSNLERAVLPERLEVLGDRAFGWCYSLRQVNVPGNLREFGNDVFLDRAMAVNAITNATADIAGLSKVVRLAADGFSMEGIDNCHVDLLALDRFAAHINEIKLGMPFGDVDDFVRRLGFRFGHGAEIGETNVKVNRTSYIKFGADTNGEVDICLEYNNDKVSRITLSEALKLGAKTGMRKSKCIPCEDVMQWL